MRNASERVLGNFLNPGDLDLADILLLARRVRGCTIKMAGDERQATQMAKSNVYKRSRLGDEADFEYGE